MLVPTHKDSAILISAIGLLIIIKMIIISIFNNFFIRQTHNNGYLSCSVGFFIDPKFLIDILDIISINIYIYIYLRLGYYDFIRKIDKYELVVAVYRYSSKSIVTNH